ncbi:MAG: DNA repair protein RecO [Chloroflexota bacterium]
MPNPRTYQTEAIIIKKIKLGEADRILTLFTPDLGKIRAVAKGVRRPRSKMSGHLELITYSLVSLSRGRNLDTISGSQTIEGFLPLKSDLELTAAALYTLELIDQFTEERQENQPLFQMLLETLRHLAEGGDREMTLRYFEMRLLDLTGYRPELYACVACGKALEPVTNFFSAGAGGMLCPACRHSSYSNPISINSLQVLRWLQSGNYETICGLRPADTPLDELRRVLRSYIRFLLEKEIKSAAFLDSLGNA